MKTIALLLLTITALAAEPGVVPAAQLAEKWKRTKSLKAPVEKLRKGLGLELGAPAAPVAVKVDADTAESFQNIQFRKDSDELTGSTTFAQLAEIAKAMQAAGTEKFLVEGHTCDLGGDAHNLPLSQRRALAVRAELVKAGVPGERLQVIGFGKSDPLVQNTDESARERNRRVQIFRKL